MKILITGAFRCTSDQIAQIEALGHCVHYIQDERIHLLEQNCDFDLAQIDAVICNSLFLHTPIELFTNLRYIQLTSAGTDRVPLDYIQRKNIKLHSARGVYSIPMAEWVVLKILEIYKGTAFFVINQKNHVWEKKRDISELAGKHACIVGMGSIGVEVAKRLKAFDLKITAVDLMEPRSNYYDGYVHIHDLPQKLKDIDVCILTLPLSPETENLFNKDMFACMKVGAILINVSRGAIVNEEALIDALETKRLSAAALDVFGQEPLAEDHPYWEREELVITPHNSFISEANLDRLHGLIISNLENIDG